MRLVAELIGIVFLIIMFALGWQHFVLWASKKSQPTKEEAK